MAVIKDSTPDEEQDIEADMENLPNPSDNVGFPVQALGRNWSLGWDVAGYPSNFDVLNTVLRSRYG